MATIMATSVGIREFKLHAPKLIERAFRGERIVITRYGRPRALLQAFTEETGPAVAPRMAEWEREKRAFERLLPVLKKTHTGRYVAILGGKVVDADIDPSALWKRVWRQKKGGTFFIGAVGVVERIHEIPHLEIESE